MYGSPYARRTGQSASLRAATTSPGATGLTPAELVAYAMDLASIFEVPEGPPIVVADPDDDVFLRCAVVAGATCVISGDNHLLDLGEYADIPILTVRDFLAQEYPEQVD